VATVNSDSALPPGADTGPEPEGFRSRSDR
jgi:hypothetical protein